MGECLCDEGSPCREHRETLSGEQALILVEEVITELTYLEANTGNGAINDLMKYALRHMKTAATDLREDIDGLGSH